MDLENLQIYFFHNGQQCGPVPLPQLLDLQESGEVPPDCPCWYEGLPAWSALDVLLEGWGLASAPETEAAQPPPGETKLQDGEAVDSDSGAAHGEAGLPSYDEAVSKKV